MFSQILGEEGKMPKEKEDLQAKVEKLEKAIRIQGLKADRVGRNVQFKQNLRDFVKENVETGATASGRIFQLMGIIPGARKKTAG